ncbi:MAG: PrsW family glutamic-type intramembrane protease [Patescibacteria group bacterium]
MSIDTFLLVAALTLLLHSVWSGMLPMFRVSEASRSVLLRGGTSKVLRFRTLAALLAVCVLLFVRYLWTIEGLWLQILKQQDVGIILLAALAAVGMGGIIARYGKWCLLPPILLGIAWAADIALLDSVMTAFAKEWGLRPQTLLIALALAAFIGLSSVLYDIRRGAITMRYRYTVAFFAATLFAWVLIMAHAEFSSAEARHDPFILALALTCIVLAWKLLFSPGHPGVKAALIATSVFWLQYVSLRDETSATLQTYLIAVLLSSLPALMLCAFLILRSVRRMNFVLLSFLGGILSTAPIVLYNVLVENVTVVNFFIASVTFRSIPSSATLFFNRQVFGDLSLIQMTLVTQMVIFLLLALLEEGSKAWIVRRGSAPFSRSLTEMLIAGILVSVGFSVAENMLNPTFFIDAVWQFTQQQNLDSFLRLLGTMISRSFVVAFVHVLATTVSTYHIGVALFASPGLEKQFSDQKLHPVLGLIHGLLYMNAEATFKHVQYIRGILYAVLLHGAFNYSMGLLDLLRTPGAIHAGFFRNVLLLMPGQNAALPLSFVIALYFIGGSWLLGRIFRSARRMQEHGDVISKFETDANKASVTFDELIDASPAPTTATIPPPAPIPVAQATIQTPGQSA